MWGHRWERWCLATGWIIPVQGSVHGADRNLVAMAVVTEWKYRCVRCSEEEMNRFFCLKMRVGIGGFTEVCCDVSWREIRGFLNTSKQSSNSSVIKLWVIMKGLRLMPGRSPLIAAPVQRCETKRAQKWDSLTLVQVLPELVCITNVCVCVIVDLTSCSATCPEVTTETFGINVGLCFTNVSHHWIGWLQ